MYDWIQRNLEHISKPDLAILLASLEQAQRPKGRIADPAFNDDLGLLKKCKIDFLTTHYLSQRATLRSSTRKFAAMANGNSYDSKVDRLRKKLSAKMKVRSWI